MGGQLSGHYSTSGHYSASGFQWTREINIGVYQYVQGVTGGVVNNSTDCSLYFSLAMSE